MLTDCPNCFQADHGPQKGCIVGLLLTVLQATLSRDLTDEEREKVNRKFDDDHFYDNVLPPVIEYMKALI